MQRRRSSYQKNDVLRSPNAIISPTAARPRGSPSPRFIPLPETSSAVNRRVSPPTLILRLSWNSALS
ncbi:hypothetical protein AXF42_Ash007335 [Apostasia shenzhenica]|uniref:Uncharacterized protein n=1 Tax=Apostasia shenzhenica TaxID=1088818 RepID=A0A2I0B9Z4_9ASPA|nr:hypothetical protein AXF42_Ash007335 [Apostasia shenzhenica]